MIKNVFFALLAISFAVRADRLDSIYNVFKSMRVQSLQTDHPQAKSNYEKCSLALVSELVFNRQTLINRYGEEAEKLLSRPTTDTSVVSPSGLFRIHYNRTGTSIPQFDLSQTLLAIDSVYEYEVNYLGFVPAPGDLGQGGDDKYDIYILELGGTTYGFTEPEDIIATDRYTSYICINNNYNPFATKGIEAVRVTLAHEYHHAIQMGSYSYRHFNSEIPDMTFYELTSTSMEEFVFTTVNDYYQYLRSFFQYPETPFLLHSGYDLAIWNLFLAKKYGAQILVKQWENFKVYRALKSIDLSLQSVGSSFTEAFQTFSVWCYFTSYRAGMNPYFPEAFNYPVYRNFAVSQFLTNSISLDLSIKPTSINPVCVSNHTSTIFDTLVVLLVNTDINSGTSTPSVTAPVELLLSRIFMQDYQAINQQYYLKTQSANLSFLFTKHILNNLEISGGTSTSGGITAFPNPLYMNVQDQKSLTIILPAAAGNKEVELNIYTANLNKVFSGKKVPFLSGNLIIQWNPLTERQVEISTGVYIYTVKINDDLLNGKFCIIR